jgi:hypothetical protein
VTVALHSDKDADSCICLIELSPQQAEFVRGLYDHGVAPSAVATVIESMLQRQGSDPGYGNEGLSYIPHEKGVPVDTQQLRVNRPFSNASDLNAGPAPPDYYESCSNQI